MRSDVHDRNTRHFPDSSLQVLITRTHNIHSVLLHSLNDTVVSIGAFVVAFESFEPGILGDLERDSVLDSELFELSDHTVSYVGYTLAQETVHGGLEDIELVLDGEVDKVGIEQDPVRWPEG